MSMDQMSMDQMSMDPMSMDLVLALKWVKKSWILDACSIYFISLPDTFKFILKNCPNLCGNFWVKIWP